MGREKPLTTRRPHVSISAEGSRGVSQHPEHSKITNNYSHRKQCSTAAETGRSLHTPRVGEYRRSTVKSGRNMNNHERLKLTSQTSLPGNFTLRKKL